MSKDILAYTQLHQSSPKVVFRKTGEKNQQATGYKPQMPEMWPLKCIVCVHVCACVCKHADKDYHWPA